MKMMALLTTWLLPLWFSFSSLPGVGAAAPPGILGVSVEMEDDWLTIVAVHDPFPASRAGLQAGDRIIRIDTVNHVQALGALTVGRVDGGSGVMQREGATPKPFNRRIREIHTDVFSTVGFFLKGHAYDPVATAGGVAALVLEKWPQLSPAEVRERIVSGARHVWQGTSLESGEWPTLSVDPITTEYKPKDEQAVFRFRALDAAGALQVDTEIPWFLNMLNCRKAWKITQGRGVVVMVSDQGFHIQHPELTDHIQSTKHFGPVTFERSEQHFHGTDMSRILLAVAPEARLVPVLCSASSFEELATNITRSFRYATELNADVVSASWAAYFNTNETLVAAARALVDHGAVLSWFHYPGAYPGLLRPRFLYWTEAGAPLGFADRFLTDPPGFHPVEVEVGLSGTAPQAAGLAALIKSVNPRLTPKQVEELIVQNATPIGLGVLIPDAYKTVLAAMKTPAQSKAERVYKVNRKVSDFPDEEDMSTPEAAYAALNRLSASGDQSFWHRLSVPRLAAKLRALSGKREISAERAARFLGAKILEVQIWHQTNAVIFAQMPGEIDLRFLTLVDGQWLNDGNDGAPNLEGARDRVASIRAHRQVRELRNARPPIAEPEKHVRPFVEFLKREAADPREFLLRALTKHRVVILGEIHNRQRYWAFNTTLVRTPAFAKHAGVIYLELPSNDQPLMDRFLAAPKYDPTPVIEVLRDMLEFGWPDQPTLEFCRAVWELNQSLSKAKRLRIVLADIARPWKEIHTRADYAQHFNVDRNEFMAGRIMRDLRDHAADPRHALFIVGCMHAPKNLTYPGGQPFKSAGWHLCQTLGSTKVFAVFPHSPVMSDHHDLDGRLALGLFETAFAALSNRSMVFPLDHGPFGELLFDHSLDFITADPYRAGFDAFLYLGPLEDEIVSPLIPGFYTEEYAREIDRRLRIRHGRGLESIPEIGQVSGEAIRQLREAWWGQPRYEWRGLGPLDAWHHGSGWKQELLQAKYREALEDPEQFRRETEELLTVLRQTDYTQDRATLFRRLSDLNYCVHSNRPGWVQWMVQHFCTNPIVQVEVGEVARAPNGHPAVPYKLAFKDGTLFKGVLPFEWRPEREAWQPLEGLDWHLREDLK